MAQSRVQGLDRLLRQLEEFGEESKARAAAELRDAADDISGKARRNAPANLGKLRQGIQPEKVQDLRWEVVAHESYSGYVEFGTGAKVYVPTEMKDIANAIRANKGGDIHLALKSIKDWCHSKGIDERAAWPILMSILHEGLRPRPFLYPAWKQGTRDLEKKLKEALERETRRFNSAR